MSVRKIKWMPMDVPAKNVSTIGLRKILKNNQEWIEFQVREKSPSASWEERQYKFLDEYQTELDSRESIIITGGK